MVISLSPCLQLLRVYICTLNFLSAPTFSIIHFLKQLAFFFTMHTLLILQEPQPCTHPTSNYHPPLRTAALFPSAPPQPPPRHQLSISEPFSPSFFPPSLPHTHARAHCPNRRDFEEAFGCWEIVFQGSRSGSRSPNPILSSFTNSINQRPQVRHTKYLVTCNHH